jgi:hypothetical protein
VIASLFGECPDPKPLRKKSKKVSPGSDCPFTAIECAGWQVKRGKVSADVVVPHTYDSTTNEFDQQPQARPDDFDPYAGVNRKVCLLKRSYVDECNVLINCFS